MTILTINSDNSLSDAIDILRDLYIRNRYLKLDVKIGKARSLDQSAISHVWYSQVANELHEDDALGVKCFCKLNFGVPILRAEDSQFREWYDSLFKNTFSYEQKIQAMKHIPITSIMTKPQISSYLETMQEHFSKRSVRLEFPKDET